jgi:hypothetical protein
MCTTTTIQLKINNFDIVGGTHLLHTSSCSPIDKSTQFHFCRTLDTHYNLKLYIHIHIQEKCRLKEVLTYEVNKWCTSISKQECNVLSKPKTQKLKKSLEDVKRLRS